MVTSDRRASRRLLLQLDISYRRAGQGLVRPMAAKTLNVSSGGICFETDDASLGTGTILELELSLPPCHGALETGGRMRGLAQVLRAQPSDVVNGKLGPGGGYHVVAARFCLRPILWTGPMAWPGTGLARCQ